MDGTIFSIEEFSTFDGPGIRTTVFLKGCPLRCQWCHNPEGQSFQPELLRSPNGCLKCGACIEAGRSKTGLPCLVEESIAACPRNLIRMCGETLSVSQLLEHLEPKLWMLESTGGGVTFSGGEPLSQPEFLLDCLKALENKTHRAVQTCGFAPSAVFQRVLQNCDYLLFDIKHMDGAVHYRYTGVDNQQILENYRALATSGKEFITRVPLIPGVNDTQANLRATAAFLHDLQVHKIELLPYHTTAGAKYCCVGRTYKPDFDQTLTPTPHTEIFSDYNIEVTIL